MKKSLSIVLVLLLLLTACQALPDDDQSLASMPSSSGSITPPSSSSVAPPSSSTAPTVPTTQPTVPTTQPTVPTTQPTESVPTTPNISTGYACIYNERDYSYFPEYDWSDCIPGQLYWMDKKTHTVTLLLAEQISNQQTEGEYIYFVKKAERNKIYRMRIAYPDQYELLYETEYEAVGNMTILPHLENYLQFMADVKRLVIYDLNTGEETVLLEVHYLTVGHITAKGGEDGLLNDWIWFYGQPTEDSIRTFYMYNRITGEFEIDDSL